MDYDRRCGMSHLLTLGILQQVQNAGGGGDDGMLYDGEMTVGSVGSNVFGFNSDYGDGVGDLQPSEEGWTICWVDRRFIMAFPSGYYIYTFSSDYPDIGDNLAHYEFGGTVYTSVQSLYTYLLGQSGNTISLKVYEDAQ